MHLLFSIAFKQLLDRKRQSLVSLMGIVLGVAFFLAISSIMSGSERDFIRRLVDNSPHLTVQDEYRDARPQPIFKSFPGATIELRNVQPLTETRGIRNFEDILGQLRTIPGVRTSAVLVGQALISFAGRDHAVTLNGMVPDEISGVTTIDEQMIEGRVEDLIADPSGIIIGAGLSKKLTLSRNDSVTLAATTGQVRTFRVVGIFRTGRSNYDDSQVFHYPQAGAGATESTATS
jgi:lipoprotein-releasing system permease protein